MVYDSGHGRTVLFGGWRSGSALGDTWEWDGIAWTVAGNTGPATRFGHAMAFDSGRERTILFGGNGNSGVFGDTWERIGVGTAFAYGAGCGTPALTLDPVASAPPTINTTAQLLLSNIGSSFTYVALGWSRTAYGPLTLPLSLAGFGMPGCDLLTSSEFTSLPVTLNGVSAATLSLPLPNMPPLIGLRCYLQGWCFAPGANPGQLIVSNGVEWDIGL
jgi:hypothetical protein